MVHVGTDEPFLLFECWIVVCVACPGLLFVVVVIAPFCEVVGEFKAGGVGGGVFKVDDNQLSVRVLGEKERGRFRSIFRLFGDETEDIAVLSL